MIEQYFGEDERRRTISQKTNKKKNKRNKQKTEETHLTLQTTIKNILTNITNTLPPLRNTNHTQYTPTTTTHPITSIRNLHIYEDAMDNPIVFTCLQVYKNTALSCDFTIDTDTIEHDTTSTTQYLNRLFHEPEGYNSQTSWARMNSLIYDSTLGMGDAFFEISTDPNLNTMNGFKYIHNRSITWYNDRECFGLAHDSNIVYEPDELIHIHVPNYLRSERVWGLRYIDKCASYVALFKNALRYNNDVLLNDGLNPKTFLKFGSDVKDHEMMAEIERIREAKRQGKGNTIMYLRNAEYQNGADTNKDANYLELLRFARDGILQVFQVPPQLAGVIETANLGSGSGESQKKNWKNTFEGFTAHVENPFNNCLKHYGFSERFHYGKIDIIDKMYDAQVNEILIRNGVKTRDEVRNELGLDPLPRGNWEEYYL